MLNSTISLFDNLIETINAKYVALSYSSGGKATSEELNEILNRHGKLIKTIELDYKKNVMADMKWTNEWLRDAEDIELEKDRIKDEINNGVIKDPKNQEDEGN